jgi:hypothetical protein
MWENSEVDNEISATQKDALFIPTLFTMHYALKAPILFILTLVTNKREFAYYHYFLLYQHLRAFIDFLEIYAKQAHVHKINITQ